MGLWKHRNVFIFEGKHGDINGLISNAVDDSALFLYHQDQVALETKVNSHSPGLVDKVWRRPPEGTVKCNMAVLWCNSTAMCGGAWITRNHNGDVFLHARDAFIPISSRLATELRGLLWRVRSLRDLHIVNCEIWCESACAIDAINNKEKFRIYLDQIHHFIRDV